MDFTELPNQVIEDYSFDLMDRLVQMRQLRSDGNNHDLSDNVPRAIYTYNYDPDRDASTTNPTDSKRYGLSETVYFDTDNNPSTPDVAKTTVYAWDYDSAGRLIQETIDHWVDSADRTETFVMDLVGNRLQRNVDYASASAVDQFFQYQYDANDRLLRETQDDSSTGIGIDQVTIYDWGITSEDPDGTTQQLSKTVTDGFGESISKQTFVYNLQGRLHQVVSESFSDGEVTSRSQVQYEYNPSGIRIQAAEVTDANLNGIFEAEEQTGITEYLIEANNHTGYAQTIVETTKNAAGKVTKRITYVFGQDEITQTTTVIDPADSSTVVSTVTHTFGHDGHGSVRALFEATAAIAQVYTYTAYGELLTLHNSSAISAPAATRLTQLGYSGEAFDARIGQQYLRARFYNPATGRFNRLDPYAGNQTDPFSYHKYAYVHGDPIQGIDPTGKWSSVSVTVSIGIGATALLLGLNQVGIIPTPRSAPNIGESLIPFWGSGKALLYNFNEGNYGLAALDAAFFISDFFLVRSLATAVYRVGWKEFLSPGFIKLTFGREPTSGAIHFFWRVDDVVFHALEAGRGNTLRVIAEKVGPDAVFRNWPPVLSAWVPVLSKRAADTCGSNARNCFTATVNALDQAGAPAIFTSFFKAYFLPSESE